MKKKILVFLSATLAMLMGVSCAQNVKVEKDKKESKPAVTTSESDEKEYNRQLKETKCIVIVSIR